MSDCPAFRAFARARVERHPQLCQKPVRIHSSSRLQQIHPHGRCARGWLRGQPKMGQDALDANGNFRFALNTEGMYRGYIKSDGKPITQIYRE